MNERLNINNGTLGDEVWELFKSSESARKLFRKVFMAYIEMPTKYKRYTMDLEYEPEGVGTVETYYLTLRKNCKSSYTKKLILLNKNQIMNTGVGYNNKQGIVVHYNLEELCRIFLREHKIISLIYD